MCLIGFRQSSISSPCVRITAVLVLHVSSHLRNEVLAVLVAVQTAEQRCCIVPIARSHQSTGLAVGGLVDLRLTVAVVTQLGESRDGLIIVAAIHQRHSIVVHGHKVVCMILICSGQGGIVIANRIILTGSKSLVRLRLLDTIAAVLIVAQLGECSDGRIILTSLQRFDSVIIVHLWQNNLCYHKEGSNAQSCDDCQDDTCLLRFGGFCFCLAALDFILARFQFGSNTLLLFAFGLFLCTTFIEALLFLRTCSSLFRKTLLFQLIALLCHRLAITVIADGSECSCSLYILLLLHQVVGTGVSSTVDGLDLVVASLQALCSLLVACDSGETALYSLHICHSTRGIERLHGFIVLTLLAILLIAFLDCFVVALQRSLKLFICKAQCLRIVSAAFNWLGLVLQVAFLADLQFGHQLTDIGTGIACIDIQRLLAEIICLGPLAILQSHEGTIQQCSSIASICSGRCLNNYRLLSCRRFLLTGDLLDTVDQILHEAQLAHILSLQVRELFRQIIWIHVLVGGHKGFVGTTADELQIAAPFVLHPNSIEVLRLGAQHHHDLRTVEGSEDVWLILLTQLVFQRNAAEEHLKALAGQLVIQIIGQHAVRCALALSVRLLVADEHIKGLFLLGDIQNALLDIIDGLRLGLVDALLHAVGILQGRLVVIIHKDGSELGTVDSGDALLGNGILHVLDAVAAQHQRPVGFSVGPVILQDLLENAHGLIIFVVPAEMIGTVIQVQPTLVVQLRDGLHAAAVFTFVVAFSAGRRSPPHILHLMIIAQRLHM